MYRVLNEEWERIIVTTIDMTKHRHLSWRKFTKEDGFDKIVKTIEPKKVEDKKIEPKKVETKKPLNPKKK